LFNNPTIDAVSDGARNDKPDGAVADGLRKRNKWNFFFPSFFSFFCRDMKNPPGSVVDFLPETANSNLQLSATAQSKI
jgi:hypothetical protein